MGEVSFKLEMRDADDVSVIEPCACDHPFAIDIGAIDAAQVGKPEIIHTLLSQERMLAGNVGVGECNRTILGATEGHQANQLNGLLIFETGEARHNLGVMFP